MKKTGLIVFITAAIVAAVLIYPNPPGHNRWYPPCVFKKFTGFDCPGCGSTRACYQLLHGNIAPAADHNILMLAFLPLVFIGFTSFFTGRLQQVWNKLNNPKIILWIIVIFWMLRNIPFFPFEWLHSDK
jgi:hypothetical protein